MIKSVKSSRFGLHHVCSHSSGESMSYGQAPFQWGKEIYFSNRGHCKPHGKFRELKFVCREGGGVNTWGKRLQSVIDCHYLVTFTIEIEP